MPLEIERKYLLSNDDWRKLVQKKMAIQQGYLNTDKERTVRVRIKKDKGILTIKGKTTGFARLEYEYEIPLKDAQELLKLCQNLIEKTRFEVLYEGKLWEIDEFYGSNEGLILAEIELESEDEAFVLPDWIDKEVSHDARYYNSSLSKKPFGTWS